MKKIGIVLGISIALLSALGCAVNPVTGKKELSLISNEQEVALGQQTDGEIRQQFGVYDDPSLTSYVESIGKALVPYAHRPELEYHFAVLDTPVVNAFAVPGGYIYLTRGILALMNSEAEMAVVLGHELGHVNARHSIRRMSQMMLAQVGLAVGSALSETVAKISGLAGVGIQLLFLKYSRDDEYQADSLGVEYSRKGGFNPGEMIGFFASLEKLGDLSGGRSLPGFLSTHPLTKDRIQEVQLMLTASDQTLARNENTYLKKIAGLIYGDDPRQGYVEGQAFYHPELAFTFSVPEGWSVQNTPARVVLVSKDKNAALLLQAEKSADPLSDYARKKGETIKGGRLVSEDRLNVPGFSSFHQIYDVSEENGDLLRLRLSLIRKGDLVYSLSALAKSLDFASYDSLFKRTVQSFSELRDPKYLQRSPLRLRLAEADGRQALQEIFVRAGMKKELWPQFAIMNGTELDAVPPAGQLIKTAS
ncbi:MAG: M48 family metalloprotease [Clostridiales bacterium]|nr:M48 family metalloprotease [Clostridiales bacterium]